MAHLYEPTDALRCNELPWLVSLHMHELEAPQVLHALPWKREDSHRSITQDGPEIHCLAWAFIKAEVHLLCPRLSLQMDCYHHHDRLLRSCVYGPNHSVCTCRHSGYLCQLANTWQRHSLPPASLRASQHVDKAHDFDILILSWL